MADLYFRNTGSNSWNLSSNWSLTDGGAADGSVPTSSDNVFFTVNSGDCDFGGVYRDCANIDLNGYVNTLSNGTFRSYGNINLGTTYNVSGLSFSLNATSPITITSNGNSFKGSVLISTTSTITLIDDATIDSGYTLNYSSAYGTSGASQILGNKWYVKGNLNVGVTSRGFTGTTEIVTNGTTTISCASGSFITNNLTISGNTTFSGTVGYGVGTLKYLSGTADFSSSTLRVISSCTFDLGSNSINNMNIVSAATITLNSALIGSTLTLPNANTTFAGAYGFTFASITNATISATRTYTLTAGNNYNCTSSLSLLGVSSSIKINLKSSITSSYTNFNLTTGASSNVQWVVTTDIDSSGGQTIVDYNGTLTRTLNWNLGGSGMFFLFANSY